MKPNMLNTESVTRECFSKNSNGNTSAGLKQMVTKILDKRMLYVNGMKFLQISNLLNFCL